jgi:hypothetical protein
VVGLTVARGQKPRLPQRACPCIPGLDFPQPNTHRGTFALVPLAPPPTPALIPTPWSRPARTTRPSRCRVSWWLFDKGKPRLGSCHRPAPRSPPPLPNGALWCAMPRSQPPGLPRFAAPTQASAGRRRRPSPAARPSNASRARPCRWTLRATPPWRARARAGSTRRGAPSRARTAAAWPSTPRWWSRRPRRGAATAATRRRPSSPPRPRPRRRPLRATTRYVSAFLRPAARAVRPLIVPDLQLPLRQCPRCGVFAGMPVGPRSNLQETTLPADAHPPRACAQRRALPRCCCRAARRRLATTRTRTCRSTACAARRAGWWRTASTASAWPTRRARRSGRPWKCW